MSTAMIVITTSSSTSVKPRRMAGMAGERVIELPPKEETVGPSKVYRTKAYFFTNVCRTVICRISLLDGS
jgi:hypothetical protein